MGRGRREFKAMENISTCVFKGKIIKKILFKINGT
jgi:hypothetical protein